MRSYFRFCFRHVLIYSTIIQDILTRIQNLLYPWHIQNPGIFVSQSNNFVILGFKFEKLVPHLKSAPTYKSKCKVPRKDKIFKFETKKFIFLTEILRPIFLDWNLKKKNYIWNQHPQIYEKVSRATQIVSILELGMPSLCNFGL